MHRSKLEMLERRRLVAADLLATSFYIINPTALGSAALTVSVSIDNAGVTAADAFDVGFYWSSSANMADGEEMAANLATSDPFYNPSKPNVLTVLSLAGNSIASRLVTIAAPAGQPVGAGGSCYLGIRIDELNVIPESSESNNSSRGEDTDSARAFWMAELYSANMTSNPGWSLGAGWQWGTPGGLEGDPLSGFTGTNVLGYNLQGAYPADMASTSWVRTPAISTAGFGTANLSLRRWLGVEQRAYDQASIEISLDSLNWTSLWSNPDVTISESRWTTQTYAVPGAFTNRPTVYFRFGMGTTDSVDQYAGWNLDDVVVRGAMTSPAPGTPDLVTDTGASTTDNLLNLDNSSPAKTLTFSVPGTVSGATVTLYAGSTAIGSAIAAGANMQIVTNGSFDLSDGVHQITARQSVSGALESGASPALAITVDTVAPSQQSFRANDGHVQRSMVKELHLAFSEVVSGDPSLRLRTGSPPTGVTVGKATSDSRAFVFTFSGSAISGASLPDGMYDLFLSKSAITDLAGNALAADVSNRFHRLFGDADGDRDVDTADHSAFKAALNRPTRYVWYFDYTANGSITSEDLLQLKSRIRETRLL